MKRSRRSRGVRVNEAVQGVQVVRVNEAVQGVQVMKATGSLWSRWSTGDRLTHLNVSQWVGGVLPTGSSHLPSGSSHSSQ